MTLTPYDWQLADLQTLRNNNHTGLLAVEPGGTKTAISTWSMMESGANQVLIVAPLNTHKKTWQSGAAELAGQEIRKIGNGTKAERQAMFDFEMGFAGWYLITPQLMTRIDPEDWNVDGVIWDEIHMSNKPRSKSQQKLEMIAERSGMRLALSGTPSRRDFTRNWSNARFLWPDLYKRGQVAHINFYLWARDRMESEEVITGKDEFGRLKKATKWLQESEPGKLYSEMPCVIQHFRREECCLYHPEGFLDRDEPQVIEHIVPLHAKQKRAIKDLESQYMTWLDDNPLIVDLSMTQKQRIRQVCLGVPTLESFVDPETEELKVSVDFEADCVSPFGDEVLTILEKLEDDEPVVIYLESQRFTRVLTERLNKAGYAAAEYSGQTKKDRDDFLARFGTDFQIIVGVISAIGTGTDGLQHVSSTEIWVERSVDDTMNDQCESRLDRKGGLGQVQRYIVKDDLGYAEGQMSTQLVKRLRINQSNRLTV